jgi:Sulfotransferase domain
MPSAHCPRLPQFVGVGPGRTGTTWLHRALEGHVDLPYGVKETQFFTTFYGKGIDWYARHFRYATGERPIAEICPAYFFRIEALERVKTHIPNCRIIATMRDPVDRLYSIYKLMRHMAAASRGPFEEILKAWPSMAGGNRYAFYLRASFENFGRENVLVTFYDELRAEPQRYLNRVTDFMGVERIALSARPRIGDHVNAFARAPRNSKLARGATRLIYWLRGHQAYGLLNLLERSGVWEFCRGRGEPFPQLSPEQDARLRERFLPEVEALEDLLRINLSEWKKPREQRPRIERAIVRRPFIRVAALAVLGGLLALGMIQTAVSPTNPFDSLTAQSQPFYRS